MNYEQRPFFLTQMRIHHFILFHLFVTGIGSFHDPTPCIGTRSSLLKSKIYPPPQRAHVYLMLQIVSVTHYRN